MDKKVRQSVADCLTKIFLFNGEDVYFVGKDLILVYVCTLASCGAEG